MREIKPKHEPYIGQFDLYEPLTDVTMIDLDLDDRGHLIENLAPLGTNKHLWLMANSIASIAERIEVFEWWWKERPSN